MSQLANVFAVKWHELNPRRFIAFEVLLGLLHQRRRKRLPPDTAQEAST